MTCVFTYAAVGGTNEVITTVSTTWHLLTLSVIYRSG